MPIYKYRCAKGHVFELFQRMSEPEPEACEICGKGPVSRVLYPVAVHFKGSGFYSTDYGSRKREPSKDGDAAASDSGEGVKKVEKKEKATEA